MGLFQNNGQQDSLEATPSVAMEGLGDKNGVETFPHPPDSFPILSQSPEKEDEPLQEAEKVQDEIPPSQEEKVQYEIPPSQPRGEPASPQKEDPKEHHILDELQQKLLTREQQDAALGMMGKGRKKKGTAEAKASAKAKAKGKAKGKATKPSPKPKGRANKKQGEVTHEEEKAPRKRRAKAEASGPSEPEITKPKRQRKAKKVDSEPEHPSPRFEVDPADPVRRTLFHGADELPSPPASSKPAAKAKPKGKKQQKEDKPVGTPKVVPKRKAAPKKQDHPKIKVPGFTHSNIVPYWSRNAVALKVPGGNGKTGLTQAGC